MSFIIRALDHRKFEHLYGLSENALKDKGVVTYIADNTIFPCRVTLEGAKPGERVFLLNYVHLDSDSPYRASHAIFVREGAKEKRLLINEIPDYITQAYISVRAFDQNDMIIAYNHLEGSKAKTCIEEMLTNNNVEYIHVHFAGPGCYFARVERA